MERSGMPLKLSCFGYTPLLFAISETCYYNYTLSEDMPLRTLRCVYEKNWPKCPIFNLPPYLISPPSSTPEVPAGPQQPRCSPPAWPPHAPRGGRRRRSARAPAQWEKGTWARSAGGYWRTPSSWACPPAWDPRELWPLSSALWHGQAVPRGWGSWAWLSAPARASRWRRRRTWPPRPSLTDYPPLQVMVPHKPSPKMYEFMR